MVTWTVDVVGGICWISQYLTVSIALPSTFFSNTHLHSGEESLKTKRTITSHLMAYGVGNQSPGLKQAQKCGGGMEKCVI
jgi:hypothetical protein